MVTQRLSWLLSGCHGYSAVVMVTQRLSWLLSGCHGYLSCTNQDQLCTLSTCSSRCSYPQFHLRSLTLPCTPTESGCGVTNTYTHIGLVVCIINHYSLGNQRTEISVRLNISKKLGRAAGTHEPGLLDIASSRTCTTLMVW